jgi:hypothetical protein
MGLSAASLLLALGCEHGGGASSSRNASAGMNGDGASGSTGAKTSGDAGSSSLAGAHAAGGADGNDTPATPSTIRPRHFGTHSGKTRNLRLLTSS